MIYFIAQVFGILTTIICLILPMMKHKWQMLVCNGLSNLFAGANILLLGQVSALPVYVIAVAQVILTLWHLKKGTAIKKWENMLFLFLYLGCGLVGVRKLLDLMPPFGAVFNMLATFQLNEQRSRVFVLINCVIFTVYYFLIGSTAMFSTLVAIVSAITALYHYRKKA